MAALPVSLARIARINCRLVSVERTAPLTSQVQSQVLPFASKLQRLTRVKGAVRFGHGVGMVDCSAHYFAQEDKEFRGQDCIEVAQKLFMGAQVCCIRVQKLHHGADEYPYTPNAPRPMSQQHHQCICVWPCTFANALTPSVAQTHPYLAAWVLQLPNLLRAPTAGNLHTHQRCPPVQGVRNFFRVRAAQNLIVMAEQLLATRLLIWWCVKTPAGQ